MELFGLLIEQVGDRLIGLHEVVLASSGTASLVLHKAQVQRLLDVRHTIGEQAASASHGVDRWWCVGVGEVIDVDATDFRR